MGNSHSRKSEVEKHWVKCKKLTNKVEILEVGNQNEDLLAREQAWMQLALQCNPCSKVLNRDTEDTHLHALKLKLN